MKRQEQESKYLLGLLLFIVYSYLSEPSEGKTDTVFLLWPAIKKQFYHAIQCFKLITLLAILS